MSINCNLA